ncbi:hypothetical protein HY949_02365 [Candidatus Gottesmanbacteria bacterium]|nr:hypothetical protein [Candidatus Gottesmanbacteria bacterium]
MPAIILSIIAVVLLVFNVAVTRPQERSATQESRLSFGDFISPTPTVTMTPTAAPSPSPTKIPILRDPGSETIECTGPDGVHFQTSQKACDDLNNFWKNPNATPIPTGGFRREKVDEHTTITWLPPDDGMSTNDELFVAMNTYRKGHGINEVSRSDVLCTIAQKRADEQQALGTIDGHAGFAKYAQDQREFSYLTEVLFGGAQPQTGVHIVEYGWDQSLTGHKEAIQDRSMSHGCGGIAGYFAAFIFGKK